MIVIGIDPHKSTHTATAVDSTTTSDLGSIRIHATLPDYRRLLTWSKHWPQHTWAVENAHGLGRHLAQWLLTHGETVADVPTTATARVRELSRGGGRKNDRIDAAAAASVAATQGDTRPVDPEGPTTVLAMLDERRTNLTTNRTRMVNQLHALLRDLLPGGAPSEATLTAHAATGLLRGVRAHGTADQTRLGLCRDLIADIRRLDTALTRNEKHMAAALDEHGTRLREVDGIGHVIAARLIGRTGRVSRFPTAAAFAAYAGAAPVQVASADSDRHRLNRGGDRQLNSALHLTATTQIRMSGSDGRAYRDKYLAAHLPATDVKPAVHAMAERAAKRALKRHLAGYIWRIMRADEERLHRSDDKVPPAA